MITAEDLDGLDAAKLGPFNYRRLAGKYLMTNDVGRYVELDEADFRSFLGGRVDPAGPLGRRLSENGFLRHGLALDNLAKAWGRKHAFLAQGTGLHIVVVTLRCNQKCVYCQTSAAGFSETSTDMTLRTAALVVKRIFETPNRSLVIEFQGGEPLANWETVRFIVERARRINKKAGKELALRLVSNLSLLDEEKLAFILENGVDLCTSLDGPSEVHDRNRLWLGGSSYREAVKWWERVRARAKGRVSALTTITRFSLDYPVEIVDEYVRLQAEGIYLRPLFPSGFALKAWERIGYAPEEYLVFYRKAMDRVIELGLGDKKKIFSETTARQFLTKILANEEPNNLDVRSPCGAGIGQVAYNYDGSVYTCDEGRMLARMGDESFRLGHVREGSHRETMRHPVVRALITASTLEAQPQCSACAYNPYDGICPIYNYATQGDIWGRMHSNLRCRTHMGILDYLFERMRDPKILEVFQRWTGVSQENR